MRDYTTKPLRYKTTKTFLKSTIVPAFIILSPLLVVGAVLTLYKECK